MLNQFIRWSWKLNNKSFALARRLLSDSSDKDASNLGKDLDITGIHLDEIDKIMSDGELEHPSTIHYPNLDIAKAPERKTFRGHNLMVIQPWIAYANFDNHTDADLQLDECVSLANTITDWKVVDKRIVFANALHRKQILAPGAFGQLKETIQSTPGVSAVMFGVELLSAIQLGTLEKELGLAVYDRFTTVLNIFRQHARTKEAKLQLALAEVPYIRSHLREIHESSEFSSSTESMKLLVGGSGESFYHRRLGILKRRESKLKYLLNELKKQRDLNRKSRRRQIDTPTVAVVGYTNSGKTTLIKYLTNDSSLVPLDQLFATLDITVHCGQLPSSRNVLFIDTVGFISRVPRLLIEAFSATLREVQDSDLILHVLDVSHPDHKLQYTTVLKALESLKISRGLVETRLTIGNKLDKLNLETRPDEELPNCDLKISATKGTNMSDFVKLIDARLLSNLRHEFFVLRIDNGGKQYQWLRKHTTIVECDTDPGDPNYLICRCIFGPAALGRWNKQFGTTEILERQGRSNNSDEDANVV